MYYKMKHGPYSIKLIFRYLLFRYCFDYLNSATVRMMLKVERSCNGLFLQGTVVLSMLFCVLLIYRIFHLLTYLLTPWSRVLLQKLTGFAANQEIPLILWNPKVHYHTHKIPPPVIPNILLSVILFLGLTISICFINIISLFINMYRLLHDIVKW